MDIQKIVSELERERERIGRAIAALVESASSSVNKLTSGGASKTATPGKRKRRRGGLTPETPVRSVEGREKSES